MTIHKVYRSQDGAYFACTLSVGRATEGWEAVTCPDCLARKDAPVDDGRGYRASIALDDIRCDVLDTGWPLGDDTDPHTTSATAARSKNETERSGRAAGLAREGGRMKPTTEIADPGWKDILDRDGEIRFLKERLRRGVAEERAAVVAWLEELSASSMNHDPVEELLYAARSIERGEHRREEEP